MASPDSRPHCQGGEKVRRKRRKEDGDDDEKKTNSEKKARMKWTPELHQIFVNAVKQVEVAGKPGPKKIVELMRVEGLTRDNVASHYQKYKLAEEKKVNEAAAAAAVHLQQKMAIYDKYVPSSEEIYLQNHSISSAAGRPMPMPMAGDGYGSNRRNLLPPLDWSNYYSIGTQNNTLAALIPPPQQPIFQPLEQNLHTHFLPNNNMIGGGIPPPPHPIVQHQGYSSAAAPAGDVGGVSQQHLHPNPNPNPNHYPAFENVDSYLNFNGQDPLSGVPEQVLPNRRAKVENRRETAEYNAETSATEKLNGGGFPPTPPTKARFQLS